MAKNNENKLPKEFVTICPKCGSINVETDFSNPLNWAYGMPPNYQCNECGYAGKFFPQIDKDKVKEFQSELRKEELKKNQKALAIWAAQCAEHVLPYFEKKYPKDKRPRNAIKACRTWIRTGIFKMRDIRKASLDSHGAARKAVDLSARFAARAAGQAVATAHVPEHAFGASYYALKVVSTNPSDAGVKIGKELDWQSKHLPKNLRKSWKEWQSRRLPKNLRALMKKKA